MAIPSRPSRSSAPSKGCSTCAWPRPDARSTMDVREAVAQTICACVLEIEDDLERHLSGTHAGILDEVRRRVELRLAAAGEARRTIRSMKRREESFPGQRSSRMDLGKARTGCKRSKQMVMRTSTAEWHGGVPDGGGRSAWAAASSRALIPSDRASRRSREPIRKSSGRGPCELLFHGPVAAPHRSGLHADADQDCREGHHRAIREMASRSRISNW